MNFMNKKHEKSNLLYPGPTRWVKNSVACLILNNKYINLS